MNFKFELKQAVTITASGEVGEVLARAEYATSENSYYLRYKAADGRATEAWWSESALAA
jgi:hypothetical protein